jgi:hypothetical protein
MLPAEEIPLPPVTRAWGESMILDVFVREVDHRVAVCTDVDAFNTELKRNTVQ